MDAFVIHPTLQEKLKFIQMFFFFFLNTKTHNDFWRLFNFILSPGTTFNAEVLDQVTIDFKRNFVVLVIANEFVHHIPQLHFQN